MMTNDPPERRIEELERELGKLHGRGFSKRTYYGLLAMAEHLECITQRLTALERVAEIVERVLKESHAQHDVDGRLTGRRVVEKDAWHELRCANWARVCALRTLDEQGGEERKSCPKCNDSGIQESRMRDYDNLGGYHTVRAQCDCPAGTTASVSTTLPQQPPEPEEQGDTPTDTERLDAAIEYLNRLMPPELPTDQTWSREGIDKFLLGDAARRREGEEDGG